MEDDEKKHSVNTCAIFCLKFRPKLNVYEKGIKKVKKIKHKYGT